MDEIRQLIFYKNHFHDFFNSQIEEVKDKIDYVLYLLTVIERVPRKFLKHITGTDGLYEVRIKFKGDIFRVFCCFDEGKVVVLFNGFQKKAQKTPRVEIDKALRIKEEYFNEQERNRDNENKKRK
jgi:phage-related protein